MTVDETAWSIAYRPLRVPGLLVQVAVLVLAEVALFASYRGHDADFHWATHFLVGLSAAALFELAYLALKGAPARGQVVAVLIAHLVAMFPDLLFSLGVAHQGWMNVFLGHIWVHYLPGADVTWLAVALIASAAYVAVLSAWLRARTLEAQAGLAPGVGLGGQALVRSQRAPQEVGLATWRPGADGPVDVLLLHGLGASHRVWAEVGARLEDSGISALAPDLLGFGASRSTGTSFQLADHVAAVRHLLDAEHAGPVVVVGHSFGCVVAVGLARAEPQRVSALVLASPPVFHDAQAARERLARRGRLARAVLDGKPLAGAICGLMCLLRRPAGAAAAITARDVPAAVARDGVQHTWPSYRDALRALLVDNPLPAALHDPLVPTVVVTGADDEECPPEEVLAIAGPAVRVVAVDADHLLPLRRPGELVAVVEQLTARGRARS